MVGVAAGVGCGAPVLAVGDVILGFWRALCEVFRTLENRGIGITNRRKLPPRCRNRFNSGAFGDERDLPRRDIDKDQVAIKAFEIDYGAMYEGGRKDHRRRLAAQVLPVPGRTLGALRTTNPIETTFATVRLWTKVTKNRGSRAAGMAMADKLIEAVQAWWRAVNAPALVALTRVGVVFDKAKLLERPVEITLEPSPVAPETEVA